tara:strand:- start:517 stop:804 length:288 start_codon:yes stop_codon:yes gene_type:complete
MKFKTGDLVHIPSGSYRVLYTEPDLKGQMKIPFSFSITQKPIVGIFKNYLGSDECLILFTDGEFAVDTRCVYFKQGVKNDRINNNNTSKRNLVFE